MGNVVRNSASRWLLAVAVAMAVVAAGCGDSDGTEAGAGTTVAGSDSPPASDADPTPATGGTSGEAPNDCPDGGCEITITSIAAAEDSSGELAITFDANFTPDFERNHIHIYWSNWEAGEVSSDFAERGFTTQGEWHPTAEYPNYVTQEAASVEKRGEATQLCVTASNGEHAVIDQDIANCTDVPESVGEAQDE